MEDKRPKCYVARAFLDGNKPVRYFASAAYINEKKDLFYKDGSSQTLYGIEFEEKLYTAEIEDRPTITTFYYGKIFNNYNACRAYADQLNEKLNSPTAMPFPKNITQKDVLKQREYIEWLFDNKPKASEDEKSL